MSEELGASPVALTKEKVLQEEKDYVVDFKDWAADGNIEQVILYRSSEGTLYTVPKNYTLFITSCYLSAHSTAARTFTSINLSDRVVIFGLNLIQNTTAEGSISFPMPIRANSGEAILMNTGGVNSTFGGIHGFLLPSKISIR